MSEPVAWKVDQLFFNVLSSAEHQADIVNEPITPLYTHPMRELTDEEIYAEMVKCIDESEDGHTVRYKDFARAILAKACNPTIQGRTCEK